ncbi:DUF1911 domain-containing protein [Verminephrobacter aporrectodeae subsp. tuberculatae]|uniref:PoNi-like cognate immunity protein n=1 Tax=Verminephrobacter aporrectodeae TaxID=1110389 RepID=UPI002243B842|nr:PoNi-like cognate immunity protein [Verminephrobacter aporrectodeae]MCW8167261.1 DUF1911 domain-containing protein [Verminephrobacter aporrectodeae subsp. tuberculatae]MCW8171498.1 DUF1911 domain-containing protein [Verminephrobacter aporrectodeae subsp. tuberculatae]
MIRAPWEDEKYWREGVEFLQSAIEKKKEIIKCPSANPVYEGQFVFDLSKYHLDLLFRRYSGGASIRELAPLIGGLVEFWEVSNRVSGEICAQHNLKTCRDWHFDLVNLEHYNYCFWLVGLALVLNIPDDQWTRLLVLVDGEGRDILLDRVISNRQQSRVIGTKLLHPKPYALLLDAIDAEQNQQARLLRKFLDNWYIGLARKGRDELWWHIYGDPVKNPLEMGNYFGRWCIEAVAAVKAFGLDDSLCLGHEHYPGDLLRPDGPSTHAPQHADRVNKAGSIVEWVRRILG